MIERFYQHVPKEYSANLRWRAAIHRDVLENPERAEFYYEACRLDILFYINTFVWTFDTRTEPFSKLPFITYPRQDDCIRAICGAMYGRGKKKSHDLRIEKSRDTGATCMCTVAFEHCWHFSKTPRHLLMVSRNEEYVDKKDNPKSLFWKFDYIVDNLPDWLKPHGYSRSDHRTKNHATNPYTGSQLDGEATTPNIARGDRRFAIFVDEFAQFRKSRHVMMATQRATNCRIFNSTPFGINNAFYDTKSMPMENFAFHWKDDPRKAIGLYTTDSDGKVKILDREGYPHGYEPILDGKLRSVSYDQDEARTTSPREMAQEWDINYLGSGGQFFTPEKLLQVRRLYAKPPILVGNLVYDTITGEPTSFQESPQGKLQLWCSLTEGKPDQDEEYVVGCDISAGSGASNSTVSVWRKRTCEKVASYANPYIQPEAFATLAVSVAKWFNNAKMIWECLGVGIAFGEKAVKDLGYRNFYFRQDESSLAVKVTMKPGWWPGGDNKLKILNTYRSALEDCIAINPDKDSLQECEEYIYTNSGGVDHAKSQQTEDPSGAGKNHGDRVIADALAWKLCMDRRPTAKKRKNDRIIKEGSLAWRFQQVEKKISDRQRISLPSGW